MRKVTKIMGLCALLVLATVSCKKSTEPVGISFKASINDPTCEGKNYLGSDNKLRWNAGDQVRVFVRNGNSAVFETQDEGATVATFSGIIGESDKYVAFYPAENCTETQDGKVKMTLSDVQDYAPNGIADDTYPLAAVISGLSNGSSFQTRFYGPCGLLCLQMVGNAKIGKIVLEDKFELGPIKHPLAGELVAKVDGFDPRNPKFKLPEDLTKTAITLNCMNVDGVQLTSTVKRFYFVLPTYPDEYLNQFNPQVLEKGLKVTIYDTRNNVIKTMSASGDNHIIPETIRLMPVMTINAN